MVKLLSLRAIVGLTAVALSIVLTFAVLRPFRIETVIERWRRQIDVTTDAQAPSAVQRLASFGRPAIPLLVELVGSVRPGVAAAAGQALRNRLEEIERLPVEEAQIDVELLIDSLAEHVEHFGPEGRVLAGQLVHSAIRVPTKSASVDRMKFNSQCRRILLATSQQRQQSAQPVKFSPNAPSASQAPIPGPRQTETLGGRDDIDRLLEVAAVPGGGLSMGDLEPPRLAIRTTSRSNSELAEPDPFPLQPVRIDKGPPRPELFWHTPQLKRIESPSPATSRQPNPNSSPERHSGVRKSPLESADSAGTGLVNLKVEQVIYRLGDKHVGMAKSAERELKRRGFRPAEIAIARRLADSDAMSRRMLVDQLPSIPGIDARPWLLQLASDEEADVRLAALSSLASLNDPTVTQRVIQLAVGDSDPRITRLADQLRR